MSGIQAAIVELQAQVSRLTGLIAELELFAQSADLSHQTPSAPPFTFDQARIDRARRAEQDGVAGKLPGPTVAHCATPTQAPRRAKDIVMTLPEQHDRIDRDVLRFLRASGPIGARKIRAGLKLSESQFKGAVARLRDQHLVRLTGTRNSAKWSAAPNAPGAKQQATKANGTEFETVWDGTKDRHGEAPSLIGDRAQGHA